jgi:hypothetical protein
VLLRGPRSKRGSIRRSSCDEPDRGLRAKLQVEIFDGAVPLKLARTANSTKRGARGERPAHPLALAARANAPRVGRRGDEVRRSREKGPALTRHSSSRARDARLRCLLNPRRTHGHRTSPQDQATVPVSRAYYSDSITDFLARSRDEVLGRLAAASPANMEATQRDAWAFQIRLLASTLQPFSDRGSIYFEYSVPRLGTRIDVVLVIDHVLFVVEFKVGERSFTEAAHDQVFDYALDLKNFHETSHTIPIAPILVATEAKRSKEAAITFTANSDGLLVPVHATCESLYNVIQNVLKQCNGPRIDAAQWDRGRYSPTPSIIEAAKALYAGHAVTDISRSDAGAINLTRTSDAIDKIVARARSGPHKAICFVTGVPGAGKTLVGLNIATKHIDPQSKLHSVFLSGNGPLVEVLRAALARDKLRREELAGRRMKKGEATSQVKAFIQNVHHFRDECLVDEEPPLEHVVLFDEAQRAWNREKTVDFMRRRKGRPDFAASEPEFLISCMNRWEDWSVVVCLVGGGQEIYRGEAGIGEWIVALQSSFPEWHIHISPRLEDAEFGAGAVLNQLRGNSNVHFDADLHLSVSLRSFRAEQVSELVKLVLDHEEHEAAILAKRVTARFPIVITRDLYTAKQWLRKMARGSERFGLVASSRAQRLKPHAIDVRAPVDPVHWFLDGKDDVRSSYFLEDAATEFQVQGLELDWTGVVWDADFRYTGGSWDYLSFVGSKWQRVKQPHLQNYLKNAYRVLLTRARQGMVIVVPPGSTDDVTRLPSFYDRTYQYLLDIGFSPL